MAEVPFPKTNPESEVAPVPPFTTERVEVDKIPDVEFPRRMSPEERVACPVPPEATPRALVSVKVPIVALVEAKVERSRVVVAFRAVLKAFVNPVPESEEFTTSVSMNDEVAFKEPGILNVSMVDDP